MTQKTSIRHAQSQHASGPRASTINRVPISKNLSFVCFPVCLIPQFSFTPGVTLSLFFLTFDRLRAHAMACVDTASWHSWHTPAACSDSQPLGVPCAFELPKQPHFALLPSFLIPFFTNTLTSYRGPCPGHFFFSNGLQRTFRYKKRQLGNYLTTSQLTVNNSSQLTGYHNVATHSNNISMRGNTTPPLTPTTVTVHYT